MHMGEVLNHCFTLIKIEELFTKGWFQLPNLYTGVIRNKAWKVFGAYFSTGIRFGDFYNLLRYYC